MLKQILKRQHLKDLGLQVKEKALSLNWWWLYNRHIIISGFCLIEK
jgi:hypothetical protein